MGSTEQQPEKPFVVMPRFPQAKLDNLIEQLLDADPERVEAAFAEIAKHAGEELPPEERQIPTNQELVDLGFDKVIAGRYDEETVQLHLVRTPATFEQGSKRFAEKYGRRLYTQPTDTTVPTQISAPQGLSTGELAEAASLLAPAIATVTVGAAVTRIVQKIRH